MDQTSVFAPIVKSTEQDDGSLLVYGKVTDDGLDLDGQRCDKAWAAAAIPAWFGTGMGVGGNVRAQHRSDSAVGKAIEHEAADDGHYITARIVDRDAILKTKAGVYSGFSVGIKNPKIVKSPTAPNGLVTGGSVVEISLVDRPANPACLITLCKTATPGMEINAADFDEERDLVRCEDVIEKATDPAVDAKESDVPTLAETLAPEALEKLAAAVEPTELPEPAPAAPAETPAVEKAADTAPLVQALAETNGDGGNAPTFDKAAAVELVDSMLAKAEGDDTVMELVPVEAPSDEVVASVAISLIAGLIQSEAAGMVDNPDEDADIKCLLNAVAALRWFIRRERSEGGTGGASDAAPYEYMAATPDAEKTDGVVGIAADALAAIDATQAAVDELAVKAAAPVETIPTADVPAPVDKTATPETTKAETVESDGDALVKALSAALEKADSPLRRSFQAIVEASTETTAQAVTELTARLVKVESMAVPGGPALRRTEVERTSARATDLALEVRKFKALARGAEDSDLRKGYSTRATQLEAELKALVA